MEATAISSRTQLLKAILVSIILLLLKGSFAYSQSSDTTTNNIGHDKWISAVAKRSTKVSAQITNKNEKTLRRLQRQEEKICRRVARKDSTLAKAMREDLQNKYSALHDKLKNPLNTNKYYIPRLDTVKTALRFLEQNNVNGNVKQTLSKLESLEGNLQQAEEIKKFISARKQLLKEQLEKLGLIKELKRYSKEAYYYTAQLNEYKEILNDSKKAERKAIELLTKTELFKTFMKKNSMLASFFRLPSNDPISNASLAGLQTRERVNNLILAQVGGSVNAQQQFQQNMQEAKSKLQQLKDKIGSNGGSSDDELPDFKPNNQKTKSFLRRLEYGVNIQSQKSNTYYPVTSDIGLSIGYKLNDKSVIGIGGSYKVGWGTKWSHINITHQGVGLRSYLDYKLKGTLWMSGAFEMNHRAAFSSVDELKHMNAWQQSGLIGLSKKYQVSKKLKGSVQLLWDFLSYRQFPRTQAIIFRVGYNLK